VRSPDSSSWIVPEDTEEERLDRYLARTLQQSRNQIQRWIAGGLVTVDGVSSSASTTVRAGQALTCTPPSLLTQEVLVPEPEALVILHQDADLLVIDKPAGLVVHPGAGRSSGTLAHRLIFHFPELAAIGHPRRPGIVHRLDRDTSGVMVIARSEVAYQRLSRDFAQRNMLKLYLGVAAGQTPQRMQLTGAIGRHRIDRKRMTVRVDGRSAKTEALRLALARDAVASLLELRLHTGRTHQIRVHLKGAGHPLIGDPIYGDERWRSVRGPARTVLASFPRPALHAWQLELEHPTLLDRQRWIAPPPADLERLWSDLSGVGTGDDALLQTLATTSRREF
jgi:23S rRNA pseudouridine1911/1915/1917 synthase